MVYLIAVSLVWAFSFGLIKVSLGNLEASAVATIRVALAAAAFLPFLRLRGLDPRTALQLTATGAIQFGLMYLLYQRSFQHLKAYEVALFTLTTPLYLALIDAALHRRLRLRYVMAALLAVAAAAIVIWRPLATQDLWIGFWLVQLSNVCFAFGQLAYRRIRGSVTSAVMDANLFALLYLGATAVCGAYTALQTDWTAFRPTSEQWLVLVYLGIVSSGLCFFGWNVGATRVNAGTLGVFNNLKLPLAVVCSILFFGEKAEAPVRLAAGILLLLAAVWIAERASAERHAPSTENPKPNQRR